MALPPLYTCTFCGTGVNPTTPGTWRKVTGWVEQRAKGGTHAVAFPSAPLAYACHTCITDMKYRLQAGSDVEQPGLFD